MTLLEKVRSWFLWEVNGKLNVIMKGLISMSEAFDLMEAKVAELKTVDDSVLALITQLVAGVQGAATLEEAQQIVAEIDVEKQRLADAVIANTK
jgi:hypothetical protein